MKNYSKKRTGLYVYLATVLVSVAVFTLLLSRGSSLIVAIPFTFTLTAFVAAYTILTVREYLFVIPNGLPRPEDELPRKVIYSVGERSGPIVRLTPTDGGTPVFWKFETLPEGVMPGAKVVYLDDLDTEYLVKWEKDGVIPILSAQSRTKADAEVSAEKFAKVNSY